MFSGPFAAYMQATQAAVDDRERQAHIAETYGLYTEAMRKAAEAEPGRHAAEAFAAYENAVREGLRNSPATVRDAFRSYVDAIRAAFDRVDGKALDPPTLSMLAYHLGLVAWMARAGEPPADGSED
jgi:hypothetical protein